MHLNAIARPARSLKKFGKSQMVKIRVELFDSFYSIFHALCIEEFLKQEPGDVLLTDESIVSVDDGFY